MPLSTSPILLGLGGLSGLISISFGLNAILRPVSGLSWFELSPPGPSSPDREFFDLIMPVYGARNIVLGIFVLAAAYMRQSRLLAVGVLGSAALGVVDGVVCHRRGAGEWNHWGYVPQLSVVGVLLTGVFDAVVGSVVKRD